MDPVTHGLVGATFSQSVTQKPKFRIATFIGFGSALLADADVFISSASDPLLNLELHRQFSHALLFIPFGALVASLLVWWFVKKRLTFKEVYLYAFAGYATAGILDYFTSYGVHLFWPFNGERYALDIISVFDPVFTLGVLIFTGLAFYRRKKLFSILSLLWMAAYLLFGFIQQNRVANTIESNPSIQKQTIGHVVVKPTIANNILWSVRYTAQDSVHSYGVRVLPFSEPRIYKGNSRPILNWEDEYSQYEGTVLYRDIQRFSTLSEGFLIRHPEHNNVIGDARYSMLPTTLSPLWGITVDTTEASQHVEFGTYRDAGPEVRQTFINMLLGK